MLVCECVLKRKKRGAGMALVLSDCESMNKKLISLFQGTLAATSETVPSQRSRGGAAECVCVCLSSQWDVSRASLTVIFTMNRYSCTDVESVHIHAHTHSGRNKSSLICFAH